MELSIWMRTIPSLVALALVACGGEADLAPIDSTETLYCEHVLDGIGTATAVMDDEEVVHFTLDTPREILTRAVPVEVQGTVAGAGAEFIVAGRLVVYSLYTEEPSMMVYVDRRATRVGGCS